jgi:hypothetical protein
LFESQTALEVTMQLSTATPAEIDTEIARLQDEISAVNDRLRPVNEREQVLAKAISPLTEIDQAVMIALGGRDKVRAVWEKVSNQQELLLNERVIRDKALSELTGEYRRRGYWTRYFVVDNDNGHLHTSTACRNTYETTSWVWMPSMSGMTHEEAVAEGGKLSCLTCFSEFREEIEKGREPRFETPRMKKTREEREATAAAKAAKQAKAADKGITAPDGSPLLDDDGYAIKTLRTAQIKAVDALEQAGLDEIYADQAETASHAMQLLEMSKRELDYASRLIEAIAVKQARPAADVEAELAVKATKKLAPARKDEAARKAAGKTAREWYAITH